ncbi:MAG: GNAT family N-acetyltransferase [Eubacteriales bacterium]|nr:GNAT family N-acetyltransferase [Eubacteriales bacterium]
MMTNKSREAVAFRDYLNDEEEISLTELVKRCNANDNTAYSFPEDADCYGLIYLDGRLCSAIALFGIGGSSNGKAVDEIAAWTDPEYRKQGLFTRLYSELCETYEVAEVKRFAVYENTSAAATLKAIGAEHIYDECIMRLRLNSADDIYREEEKFDSIYSILNEMDISEDGICECRYGSCSYKVYGNEAYIYGVLIYDSFRSQGYGFKMMYSLLKQLREKKISSCFLEVNSLNIPAVELYKKTGFKIEERIKYYEQVTNLE